MHCQFAYEVVWDENYRWPFFWSINFLKNVQTLHSMIWRTIWTLINGSTRWCKNVSEHYYVSPKDVSPSNAHNFDGKLTQNCQFAKAISFLLNAFCELISAV